MTEKTYKARVELSLILEFSLDAVHEDEAATVAEEIVSIDSQDITDAMSKRYRIPNIGIRCIEVEECSEPN